MTLQKMKQRYLHHTVGSSPVSPYISPDAKSFEVKREDLNGLGKGSVLV